MSTSTSAATDVGEFITDLDGGMFDRKLSIALSQVAAAAVDNDKVGEVSLKFTFSKIPGTKQVQCKHQLKFTRQRELILDAFLQQEHITAEEMYHQLAKKDPHLGLATIYRTLNLFCEAGLAQARHFGTQTQYDNISHKGHHDHLICTDCGKIVEFENCEIEKLQEEVATRNGFTISTHRLELYGLCGRCRH